MSSQPAADASVRLREERDFLDFFEHANVALHLVRADGTILRANQAELDMLGYRSEDYVGRHIADFHVDRPLADDPVRFGDIQKMMERQLAQLVRLIDDLLDVTRISRGTIHVQKHLVELGAVIRQAVETSTLQSGEKQHAVELALPDRPIHLDGDPVRLGQVFSNLINNAQKYTPPGGSVRISAEVSGLEVVVSIQDSGIGIPPQELGRIFDMFCQLNAGERTRGEGLGIGLSLARRLVELHGGSITARSEGKERGSEFIVRLPMPGAGGDSGTAQEPRRDVPRGAPGVCRILVVDDNVDALQTLALLLELQGHDVRTASDGQQAIEQAVGFRPALILLDIGLPRPDGYDVCRRIRQEPWGRDVTIVAVTGWGQEADRLRSRSAGFDDHLVKPVEPAQLERLIMELPPDRRP